LYRFKKAIIALFLMTFFVSYALCGEEGQKDQKQKWLINDYYYFPSYCLTVKSYLYWIVAST